MTRSVHNVHFIGIGGIGMSSLAQWFKSQGWRVSGSDTDTRNIIIKNLKREGIRIMAGHSSTKIPISTELVIHSQAIQYTNHELKIAAQKHLPTLSYPETVGFITQYYTTVAIAGAHGKSTTTALTALALIEGKLDPTVIIGATLKEFGNSNFRKGDSPLLVLEADEYGKAFLYYLPKVVVVTNIDREHLEIYSGLPDIKKNFLLFLSRTSPGGTLVLNWDDKNLSAMLPAVKKIAVENRLKVIWYSVQDKESAVIKKSLSISGAHNLSNALAAYNVAVKIYGVSPKKVLEAFRAYKGAWRRMEYRGSVKWKVRNDKKISRISPYLSLTTMVYDDYAHHPTEIKATLAAFREKFPHSPLICIFQPHQALRLQKLFSEFSAAFENAEALIVLPTYHVQGRDHINSRFTAEKLAKAIHKKSPNKPVLYLENPKKLKHNINILKLFSNSLATFKTRSHIPNPIIIMMGAGDIVHFTDNFMRREK